MPNEIYTSAREKVRERDDGRCVRCRMPGVQWHHRRRRREQDEHTNRPCNGLTLCVACHEWITTHPFEARKMGWIVRAHQNPEDAPVMWFGVWVLLTHDGSLIPADPPD